MLLLAMLVGCEAEPVVVVRAFDPVCDDGRWSVYVDADVPEGADLFVYRDGWGIEPVESVDGVTTFSRPCVDALSLRVDFEVPVIE